MRYLSVTLCVVIILCAVPWSTSQPDVQIKMYSFSTQTRPLPITPPSGRFRQFLSQTTSRMTIPAILYPLFFLFAQPMKMEQSVPKRRHIKFRRREITQKKECNIQNTVKVWIQE